MKLKNLAMVLSALFLLSACSEKKEEKEVVKKEVKAAVGKIEVVQNDDAFQTKVEEKENTSDRSYYYSYNKETESNDKTYSQLDANMRVRSPYEKVEISMLVSQLSKNFVLKCSSCHNNYANGIIGPSLLNKDEHFIYSAINDFKTGKKTNVLMNELLKGMDESEIKGLAKEIAQFNAQIQKFKKDK